MIAIAASIGTMFAVAFVYKGIKWAVTEYKRRNQ
jgi:hypothetical protein